MDLVGQTIDLISRTIDPTGRMSDPTGRTIDLNGQTIDLTRHTIDLARHSIDLTRASSGSFRAATESAKDRAPFCALLVRIPFHGRRTVVDCIRASALGAKGRLGRRVASSPRFARRQDLP